jgi:hypothetical protein
MQKKSANDKTLYPLDEEDEEDEKKKDSYKWTKEFERTWETITEDERGLVSTVAEKKYKYTLNCQEICL